MTAPNTMAKRAAAGTLALAVCFTGGVLGAGAAQAAPGFAFDQRISGPDRTATAIAASRFQFDDGSDTVIIVERDAVVDGLTASYAAGLAKAPILYVDRQGVPDQVAAEIRRLGATKATLVGGTAVLPQAVVTQLESAGLTVTRQSGPDRYATAAAVARSGSNMPDKVIVASGEGQADSLAAGPIAYARNYPIVLVRTDSVPDSSRDSLDKLGSGERLAIGGTVRINDAVYNSLGESKRRISGPNRQATAVALANIATGELGFNEDRIALVSNADRAAVDALVAAPVAGENLAPLLFTSGANIGVDTEQYLRDHAAELTGPGYIFGGTAAVPQSAADQATAAAGGGDTTPPGNVGLNITPNDAQTLVIATPDDTTDDRTYRVAGLDDSLTYRVTLVNAENVNVAADGSVTFRSSADSASASGFSADPGTRSTIITVVNGSPVAAGTQTATADPVGGNLSFTIDGVDAESVYPVVYVNGAAGNNADQGGPSERLETQATAAGQFAEGAERYGLGGLTTYVPEEASAGPAGAADPGTNIDSVNKAAGYFITTAGTYFYDGNDQFRVDGRPVTLATFAASLSSGDGLLESTYADDPDLQSTFSLNDLAPNEVTDVVATAVDDTSVEVTWTNSGEEPETYTIYRKAGGTETDDLDDYTAIATLPGSTTPLEYTDNGLAASTDYVYAVTQTVDGDESSLAALSNDDTDSVDAVRTAAPGVTAAPQSIAAGVTNDDSFAGTVSPGDEYTIAFNRPLDDGTPSVAGNDASVPADAVIRIQDANGESIDLVNGGDGSATENGSAFALNTEGETFNGRVQPAGTLLTVIVGAGGTFVDRDGNTANNNGSVDYPATIVAQSGITATVNDRTVAWNPATSTDNVLETGATAPIDAGPVAESAEFTTDNATDGNFSTVGDVFSVVYDENIQATIPGNASITVGGVTLVNGVDVDLTGGGTDTLIVTYRATGKTVNALVGKQVTATSGITDEANPTQNGAQPASGYPVTVTVAAP